MYIYYYYRHISTYTGCLFLWGSSVYTHHHCVVTFIRLQCQLFLCICVYILLVMCVSTIISYKYIIYHNTYWTLITVTPHTIIISTTHTPPHTCGFKFSSCSFFTSLANTASAGAVESIQLALIDITKCPPFLRK